MEVFVFRDQNTVMFQSKLPDRLVRCSTRTDLPDLDRVGKKIAEQSHQVFGQMLVEEQAHDSGCGNAQRPTLTLRRIGQAGQHVLAG